MKLIFSDDIANEILVQANRLHDYGKIHKSENYKNDHGLYFSLYCVFNNLYYLLTSIVNNLLLR